MNPALLALLVLVGVSNVISGGCKDSTQCDKSGPYCVNEKCVQCLTTADCNLMDYCAEDGSCKGIDNSKFGTFCNSDSSSDGVLCGEMNDDKVILWSGSCLNFVCQECTVGQNDGLAAEYRNAHCYPKSGGSSAGKVKIGKHTDLTGRLMGSNVVSLFLLFTLIFFGMGVLMQGIVAFYTFKMRR